MSYQTLGKDRDRHSGETVNIDTRERPEGGNMYKLDLHMFDGGEAAGGAPAAGSTAQAGGTATQAGGTAVQTEGTQSGEQEGMNSPISLRRKNSVRLIIRNSRNSTRICTEKMSKNR